MLDLQAGVHFEEVEVLPVVDEEFDGACVGVAGGLREADRGFAHASTQTPINDGGGSFFDDFLVATLDGAFTLTEGDAMAVFVGQDLDFDMAGVLDKFFEVDVARAEGAVGLAAG